MGVYIWTAGTIIERRWWEERATVSYSLFVRKWKTKETFAMILILNPVFIYFIFLVRWIIYSWFSAFRWSFEIQLMFIMSVNPFQCNVLMGFITICRSIFAEKNPRMKIIQRYYICNCGIHGLKVAYIVLFIIINLNSSPFFPIQIWVREAKATELFNELICVCLLICKAKC